MPVYLIWIIVGLILIISEFFIPGLIAIFFGVAALIVGLLVYLGIIEQLGITLLVFTALSILEVFTLRKAAHRWFTGGSIEDDFPEVDDDFTGKEVTAITDFSEPVLEGKVTFKGSPWTAKSLRALKAGEKAFIKDRNGLTLIIE